MALVFVIDPRLTIANQARAVLVGRGHRVQTYRDLDSAADDAESQAPDIILASLDGPPRQRPDDCAARIKRDWPQALFIFHSQERDDERLLLAALGSDATDLILLPFLPAELAARTATALRSKARAERQTRSNQPSGMRRHAEPNPRSSAHRRALAARASMPATPPSRADDHSTDLHIPNAPLGPIPTPALNASVTPSVTPSVTDVLGSGELSALGVLKHALVRDDARLQGRVFDAYRLVRTLGVGGMGVVLEAIHRETGKRQALKILRSDIESEPEAPLRFLREAYVLQGIHDPHVVRLEDIGRAGGTIFYAMEFVDGITLADVLDNQGQLELADACHIAAGCARALAALARASIVHRDVKPANIIVSKDISTVKLSDFGLAKRARARDVTPRKSLIGTPHYIAPEVVAGEQASPRSDLYSLGVVLHEMLSGQPLHRHDQTAALLFDIVYGNPPDIDASLPDTPPEIRSIVRRATQRYPQDRYDDPSTMAIELELIAARNHRNRSRRRS